MLSAEGRFASTKQHSAFALCRKLGALAYRGANHVSCHSYPRMGPAKRYLRSPAAIAFTYLALIPLFATAYLRFWREILQTTAGDDSAMEGVRE